MTLKERDSLFREFLLIMNKPISKRTTTEDCRMKAIQLKLNKIYGIER